MTIELTEEQQKIVRTKGKELTFVHASDTDVKYVLIPIHEYETLAADEEDRREQEEWHRMARRNMVRRMQEDE